MVPMASESPSGSALVSHTVSRSHRGSFLGNRRLHRNDTVVEYRPQTALVSVLEGRMQSRSRLRCHSDIPTAHNNTRTLFLKDSC